MSIWNVLRRMITGGKRNSTAREEVPEHIPQEYKEVLAFNRTFDALMTEERFIARSDYKELVEGAAHLYQFYETLSSSNVLDDFIRKSKLDSSQIDRFRETYAGLYDLTKESPFVQQHNEEYVKRHLVLEKDYLDTILKECDPAILLDEEQRRALLSEEDHTLVIAGAGAGKTTTVAAKVKYLVDKRGIEPSKILVISFTNKAVGELRERINGCLHINCPITTFHSAGYAILRKGDSEGKRIVDGGYMYAVINKYLKSAVMSREDLVKKLILFFGSYFTAPYEGDDLNRFFRFVSKADFSTLKSNLHEYVRQIVDRKTEKVQTLNNEILRSIEEVRIANWLYLHQIDYEYEPVYRYRVLDASKPYTPDFRIKQGDKESYIEHFGITEDGRNSRYTPAELERYKARVNDKIRLHRKHKTDLIYTFSAYRDGRSFLEHLEEQLLERGYVINERPLNEVYKKLVDAEENKYITKFTLLICHFISNFKTQGYKAEKFEAFKSSVKNVRTRLFLDICSVCFLEYQKALKESCSIDFEDMINESAELIRKKQVNQEHLDFKYIIVDEYQDISRQRYNLIRELSALCSAKIVAVGDDWQSIYAFSGSILPLFTRFCQEVGYGQELKITRTYRNAQEVIDIAGAFIQRNENQIKKALISPKRITNPVVIRTYSEKYSRQQDGGRYYNLGIAVNEAISDVIEYNKVEGKSRVVSILLIGRYGFDAVHLCRSKEFNYDEKSGRVYSSRYGSQVKLQFLTAHSSKGLSADNVIIINAKDDVYGFPSKVDDDPVLSLVVVNDNSYTYAEERRLFYVALTRTKNRVFIVTPSQRPSEFIKELLSDTARYPNVTLKGELASAVNDPLPVGNRCPICGYPMQLRWNKNYGLKLWICTNEQELCGFMTNDMRGGELGIQKCDWCEDGYLVVKPAKQHFILGCTNYKDDKSGCGRMLGLSHYRAWLRHDFGTEDRSVNCPSYFKKKPVEDMDEVTPPEMIPVKAKRTVSSGSFAGVNMVEYTPGKIDTVEFRVLTNAEGQIITDMELLRLLYELRMQLAQKEGTAASKILQDAVLVRLATDKPTDREEFLRIYGIGDRKYEAYGDAFLSEIKSYVH